jgi:hypothetical protein
LLRDRELSALKTGKPHDAKTLYLLRTIPGIGAIVSLGLRYESHDLHAAFDLSTFFRGEGRAAGEPAA